MLFSIVLVLFGFPWLSDTTGQPGLQRSKLEGRGGSTQESQEIQEIQVANEFQELQGSFRKFRNKTKRVEGLVRLLP